MQHDPSRVACPAAPGDSTHEFAPDSAGNIACRYCNRNRIEILVPLALASAGLAVLDRTAPTGTVGIKVARIKDTAVVHCAGGSEVGTAAMRREAKKALLAEGFATAHGGQGPVLYVRD